MERASPSKAKSVDSQAALTASSEIDETLIRSIFLKNKQSELFVQETPELLKESQVYQDWFQDKEDRRRTRFLARLAKGDMKYSTLSLDDYRVFSRKGFPSEHRAGIYEHMLDLKSFEAKYGFEYFTKCLKTDIPSSIGRVIQADIPRTLSAFLATCGEVTRATLMKMLRDVLWAFAVHKPEIGYCQSMNFIAAFFISVFGSAKKSFYALVQLIDSPTSPYVGLHIPGYYAPGMRQLLTDIGVLEIMSQKRLGEKVFRDFFEKREIASLSMIASEWFLTCFITVFPIKTVHRIMDLIVGNCAGTNKVLFRIAFVIIRELVNRKHELVDLDQLMQGHKRITKKWVQHNDLIKKATKGLKNFSKRHVDEWRTSIVKSISQHSSASSGGHGMPMGNTMMRLEEALAPQTQTSLTVPEDAVVDYGADARRLSI
jgi:hypothetical protein